jgi:hypothetical protein
MEIVAAGVHEAKGFHVACAQDILVSIKPHPLVSCARRESILTRVA